MEFAKHLEISSLRFVTFSSEDIKKFSVAKVITPLVFDALGNALPGGLYDPAMGPYCFSADPCVTCGGTINCPGHSGHIELCTLVYNPVFIKTVYSIMRMICHDCYKLQISEYVLRILDLQLRLLDVGYVIEAQELEEFKCKTISSNQMAETSVDENTDILSAKFDLYNELVNKEPINHFYNNKNTESLRSAIVSTAIQHGPALRCMHCKSLLKKIKYSYKKLVMTISKTEMASFYERSQNTSEVGKAKASNKAILGDECRQYLREAYKNNTAIFKLLFPMLKHCSIHLEYPIDIFFMDVIPVTPPNIRPANKLRDAIIEHPQTVVYKKIIEANMVLRTITENLTNNIKSNNDSIQSHAKDVFDLADGSTPYEKMYNAWQSLQTYVDQIWDANMGKDRDGQGLKQILEKKEGIIRMHMMGKRVNYAARTVITPDPYINVDEIGIPDVFAKKLSYPVPVTTWNVSDLRKLVINGPEVHPGANFIEDEKGNKKIIPCNDELKRESMAKMLVAPTENGVTIVHRHLVNGDVLLLNRQPSLHRPSIMAHKARILKGEKTFRLHYSNCKSYNADFDGDEMNAHFPQNELGRSEGYNLANVSNQYLVPKDGTPLGGLIQDHVISGVRLSMRGRFFNREDYQQLVYMGLAHIKGEIKTLRPAILKPIKLWSGKQILSTIIINVIPKGINAINLESKAKINAKAWQSQPERKWNAGGSPLGDTEMSESQVIIKNGELLVGVLDKTHYGATPYGLIHCMYELYGGNCSVQLLTSFAKLFTTFLQREGFTLGVHDILVLDYADKKRSKTIKKCRLIGHKTASAALDLLPTISPTELADKMEEAYIRDPKFRAILDRQYKSALDTYTNKINKICLPAGLLCKFPENNLQLMVTSGAKGSTVNTMQISCLLGQIELEGKRPPLMISGKSLPSFAVSETSPKSGGFIDGRFMTGIQPQDFFFHCMAGREGLIDTAVKTSRSGYLQRCLIKHLEGLNVNYDMTVRDSDNSVIQFLYGEDGLDISKAQFLKPEQLSFLDQNASAIVNPELLENLKNDEITNYEMLQYKKKLRSWSKKHGSLAEKKRISSFQQFSMEISGNIDIKKPNKIIKDSGRRRIDQKIIKKWLEIDEHEKQNYLKKCLKCPDPTFNKYKPDCHFGSISEHLEKLIVDYLKEHPNRKHEFTHLMCVKGINSLVSPGEPVGLLAAQSIGEPSTQMTLNTFHFAGRGEMNVTLGIPRLREILMMASANIKTPSMDIPFKQTANMHAQAERLRLKLIRVTLAEVLESINIKSHIVVTGERFISYTLRFNFLPNEVYKNDFAVKPKQILKYMTNIFFAFMFKAIKKSANQKFSIIDINTDEKAKTTKEKYQDLELDEGEPENNKTLKKTQKTEDSSDEEELDADDDATATKIRSKNVDENDYDEPNVDEEKNDATDNEQEPDDVLDNEANDDNDAKNDDDVVQNCDVESYTYDKHHHLWCEVTFHLPMKYKNVDFTSILREIADKSVISEVPLIKRAITYTQNNDLILKTDGINIIEMFKYSKILDLNRLYSNHIHGIAKTYGIEAAGRVIVKEVKNVFNVYGITVDPRHLLLIADYMTFDGTYKPLSRFGMESSASPLQQMSFESSVRFLKDAIVSGRCDNLNSPSSRLMVGQPCKSGTGAFTLINQLNTNSY